ncbi:MAG: alanyl-tRNA editing protein [Candidatus Hermodarchaeota archaeon]
MTEKLYWKHPYDTQFDAKVVKIIKEGVILDKTLFYPRSGNQANDIGQLIFNNEKFEVKKVYSEGEEIIHEILPEELNKFKVGDIVKGVLDWENRYGLMKAHTSQHILSALFKNKYGINTSRAFIEREEVLIQLEMDTEEYQLQEVLIEFFTLCTIKNIEIKPNVLSLDEAQKLGNKLRGKFPVSDWIRIVEIENLDLNCCGGTHIKYSTEIGPVLIIEFKKNRDIKYLLGNKAIQRFSQINMELLNLSDKLNTPLENYARDVKKVIELNQALQTYQELLISELFKQKLLNPDLKVNNIKLYLINMEIEYKSLKKILDQLPDNSLLLIKSEENKVRIISNTDKIKSDEIAKKFIENYRGKGGGNPRNAQCLLENEPKDILGDIQGFIKQ